MPTDDECDFDQQKIPPWLTRSVPEDADYGTLASARSEFYTAPANFYTHTRYAIAFWFALFGIVFILLNINEEAAIQLISGTILFFVGFFIFPLLTIIRLNYSVYVCALVFAVKLHYNSPAYKCSHPWFKRTIRQIIDFDPPNEEDFITRRIETREDAFAYYRIILISLAAASSLFGILLIITTNWSCVFS